nr:nucleoside triphosphate pyrophosphohydrolase [Gottschalkia purinilytica]
MVSGTEYLSFLEEKLIEEVDEFNKDENLEELADILEVVYALTENLGHTIDDLLKKREEKKNQRGGFKKRVVLKNVY